MRLLKELRSHLQYKIILPFLLLTMLVALVGSAVSFLFITGTAQERLNNQLAQVARTAGDSIVARESANLQFLREIAFAGQNTATGAPGVAQALEQGNLEGLQAALTPYYRISNRRSGVRIDRIIVFDTRQRSLIDWEHPRDERPATPPTSYPSRDISRLWFVRSVLEGKADALGDKYAGLMDLSDSDARYLFTAAPVVNDTKIVGGVIVATRLDTLLQDLNANSSSAFITLYRADDGSAFASSITPMGGLQTLTMRPEQVAPVRDMQLAEKQGVFDTVDVNQRQYQLAFAPLRVRGETIGLISVALAADYVTGPWSDARLPLTTLTIVLMLAIIGLGVFIARQITRPLQELVDTAQAVTSGDLQRRSTVVTVGDEIGLLAGSFNNMTQHLTDLYSTVRTESSQRAAIVESITDSVLVCNPQGEVLVINRATRALLGLKDDEPGPQRFLDLPLHPLSDMTLAFGDARTPDLFQINGHIVRVQVAPVIADDQTRLGDVYVLQDLTSEVAIDRAKTNFIATISHELRTPLTVLGGSSELLLRELVGPITGEQRELLESMRKHTLSMTTLLNNVITIAGLESGTLTLAVEPIGLQAVLDELLWSIRPAIKAKGLQLIIDLPADLPNLLADAHQLRNVLNQLLDNARRYTDAGSVTISARRQDHLVRVDITDTGRGIQPEMTEQIFTRFNRGESNLSSSERGIGLGLAIAKMLLERQGGALWLETTSEHGSTFSFTLPSIDANTQHNDAAFAPAA